MKTGNKTLSIVLLFAGLVLVNYLASFVPFRIDATEGSLYTLSPGTKAMLGKIEEPVTLEFYFSRSAKALPVSFKNFAERVREMLQQYVRASKGKLTLTVIDPLPDTPEEERAVAAGLQPQGLPGGEKITFGLVATQADQTKVITVFDPQRESFLEYDVSQLIHSVQQVNKRKLGLISSLPLKAPPMDFMAMQQGRRTEGQVIHGEWAKSFDIVNIEPTATELPAGLDLLAVVHPDGVTERLQFAIDQFLLAGKPVLLAVDPSSQHMKQQGRQAAMYGAPPPKGSSDLPVLLKAYGIAYDPNKVVGDLQRAVPVQTRGGAVEHYPIWLRLGRADLSRDSTATAQLNSLMFIESGSLSRAEGSSLDFVPLVQTSDQAGVVDSQMLQFAQPDEVARQLVRSGRKTLAALVTGTFRTAFPGGAPKESAPASPAPAAGPASPKAGDKGQAGAVASASTPAANGPQPSAQPALKEGRGTLIVVADTDWLMDDYSVRRLNFLGSQALEPLNDNLYFGLNLTDLLGGSSDLLGIRGKGNALRPFTVVQRMEAEAQKQYREQLVAVEAKLGEVQRKLSELQARKGEARTLVATPEVSKALEDYQRQELAARKERREIRRALREDIDALENTLVLVNLLLSPLLVGVFGFFFQRSRKHVTSS